MRYLYIILVVSNLFAQQKDKPAIQVQYFESIKYRPTIVNNYDGILSIQNEFSFYTSKFINTEKIFKTDDSSDDEIIVDNKKVKFTNEIFINTLSNELTENLFEEIILKKSYSVYENIPKMKWLFLKGDKKFNNMNCKKAQTTFRGRTYIAWYTLEIPVSIGPWKFSGLPGLILSIEDTEKVYKWEIKKINYPYKEKSLNLADNFSKRFKYKKVSFKEYDKIYVTAIKDKISIIAARNKNREYKSQFSFSTFQNKEPQNEIRTQMEFK
ncbi:MAG: GLPGLI family protein [Flavobacterium sp. JAD_PAG50586_2]|nr:MAG: GLPGLI family protein [Flavobacterium sp. JAD_PAG50586_2]